MACNKSLLNLHLEVHAWLPDASEGRAWSIAAKRQRMMGSCLVEKGVLCVTRLRSMQAEALYHRKCSCATAYCVLPSFKNLTAWQFP